MEKANGNTSAPGGLVPTDGGGTQLDLRGLSVGECIAHAEEALEKAKDRLQYGRRQECEEALELVAQVSDFLTFAAVREGERSGEAVDGEDPKNA